MDPLCPLPIRDRFVLVGWGKGRKGGGGTGRPNPSRSNVDEDGPSVRGVAFPLRHPSFVSPRPPSFPPEGRASSSILRRGGSSPPPPPSPPAVRRGRERRHGWIGVWTIVAPSRWDGRGHDATTRGSVEVRVEIEEGEEVGGNGKDGMETRVHVRSERGGGVEGKRNGTTAVARSRRRVGMDPTHSHNERRHGMGGKTWKKKHVDAMNESMERKGKERKKNASARANDVDVSHPSTGNEDASPSTRTRAKGNLEEKKKKTDARRRREGRKKIHVGTIRTKKEGTEPKTCARKRRVWND